MFSLENVRKHYVTLADTCVPLDELANHQWAPINNSNVMIWWVPSDKKHSVDKIKNKHQDHAKLKGSKYSSSIAACCCHEGNEPSTISHKEVKWYAWVMVC